MSMEHVHVHASCPCWTSMFTAHHRCVCVCEGVFVGVFMCVFVCINAGLSGIRSVWYRNKKTNDAVTGPVPDQAKAVRHFFGPVPDWNYWWQNADAGVSFLDTDAQLWFELKNCRQGRNKMILRHVLGKTLALRSYMAIKCQISFFTAGEKSVSCMPTLGTSMLCKPMQSTPVLCTSTLHTAMSTRPRHARPHNTRPPRSACSRKVHFR